MAGAVTCAIVLHVLLVARRRLILGPETLFLGLAVGTYLATLAASIRSGSLDGMRYASFIGLGIVSFVLGAVVANLLLRFDHRRELDAFVARPWLDDLHGAIRSLALFIGAVAVAVAVAYYVSLGAFVPLMAFRAFLQSGTAAMVTTYNELRASTRSGTYLGLGYVVQFKDVLLPLVASLFVVQYRLRSPLRSLLVASTFTIAVLAVASGTGGRFALAMVGLLFLALGVAPYMRPAQLTRIQNLAAGVVLVAALTGLTLMMGPRGQQGPFESILWAPYQVLERVCVGPARERLIVFEWFLSGEEAQLGSAALEGLGIALPGPSEYNLPNQLHELLYGGATGNVALDVWGGLWYDWHWKGLGIAVGLGALFHGAYVLLLRGRKSVVRVVALTHAGLILGLAPDLHVLLLRGFATVHIFLLLATVVCVVGPGREGKASRDLAEGSALPA